MLILFQVELQQLDVARRSKNCNHKIVQENLNFLQ